MLWILDYEADIEADFLRFYGVYDYEEVEAKKYLRLTVRLFAYDGVLAARYAHEQENGGDKVVVNTEHERKRLYKDAGIKKETVTASGPDYLQDKLRGPTL